MLDTFFNTVSSFSPDLLLFSGLHLMEREERSFIIQKLAEVRNGFDQIDSSIPVHLELASMANPSCVKDILNQVLFTILITKTYLYTCNFDPLKPNFYVVKLGLQGYTLLFLFLLKSIDCEYSLEPPW